MDPNALIILYDIPSTLPNQSWSPNTWKIRYALNIKRLPYKTCWLRHHEIEPEMRRIGAQPTTHFFSGTKRYTLPAIFCPRTQTAVSDSSTIIFHIENHYPETRSLFPLGTRALQHAFVETRVVSLERVIFPLIVLRNSEILLAESQSEWRARRESWLGKRLEDVAPPGAKRDAALAAVLKNLEGIDECMRENRETTIFLTGGTPIYCDVALAAALTWMWLVLGEDSPEWGAVMGANKGRWRALIDAFKHWENLDY
ncbi:hypothetical protein K488DRAFT_49168 [Vararia minispora EC-137]|uniref:Uncharacterized protein n=1 Tax=Vararia minispora EC-137 TaxID=1314806 RepID=A0ACB8QMS3_9AGAM|nr:hypothetical protein K488DRAFT_49168 [Vararia minispora EC-137]